MAIRTRDDDTELEESHEINVTPFIDVMLVLLIIFMVAAPLATVDVPVDLPASTAQAQAQDEPDKPLYLTVNADLSLSLDQQPIGRDALRARLDEATAGDHERRIFLRADHRIAYGELMSVMNVLRDAGYLKVALVAQEQAGP